MNILKSIAIFVLLAGSLLGQLNTLAETTISASVTSSVKVIPVASATGISAGKMIYIDREAMAVDSVSGTNITVRRGRDGTRAVAHLSGAVVFAGDPDWFYSYDQTGKCVPSEMYAKPAVNVRNGKVYDCTGAEATSQWTLRQPPRQSAEEQTYPTFSAATITTVGNVTLTAAQILGGIILRDPNGGARTDTLPTATLLKEAIPGVRVGTAFEFTIRNTADAAETITVASGTGGTDSGTMTIAQSNSKRFLVIMTAVGATPTYTVYSLGTIVH